MEDTEENRKIVVILAQVTLNLYLSVLVGNPAPIVKDMYELILNPQIGNLVLEISSRHRHPFEGRLGWLKRISEEPIDDEWDEAIDGPRPLETYWYIEGIDGQEHRWENCMFIRVLDVNMDGIVLGEKWGRSRCV